MAGIANDNIVTGVQLKRFNCLRLDPNGVCVHSRMRRVNIFVKRTAVRDFYSRINCVHPERIIRIRTLGRRVR